MVRRWRSRRAAVRPARRLRGDRGTLALELSIVTPAIVALLWMMISAGRVAQSASKVQGAARDGARAVSINHNRGNTPPQEAAQIAVENSLRANGVTCVGDPQVSLTSEHGAQPQPGDTARVTVTCQVALLLGQVNATVSREAASLLDVYRGTT